MTNGECWTDGTDALHNCVSVTQWKWPNHAIGVVPLPRNRVTVNGSAGTGKHIRATLGDLGKGTAISLYNAAGAVTADQVLNTPVNHVAFMGSVNMSAPVHGDSGYHRFFIPGRNVTNGCGDVETAYLPFGYDGHSIHVEEFQDNLKKLYYAGVTITLTLGAWCTKFPVAPEEEWTIDDFDGFVNYFRELRANVFGNNLDGLDF